MKKWIEKLKSRDDDKGMTIVELMVAVVILVVALLGIEISVAAGLAKLKDQQVSRGAAECARVVMEYFSTVPIDLVYEQHTSDGNEGKWAYSNFDGGGFPALSTFVWNSNSTCKDYSDITHPIGAKVKMRYGLCPSCVAHTEEDTETFIEWTTCYYELKTDISYNGLIYGGTKSVGYTHKFIPADMANCEAICGTAPAGQDMIYPCPDD